MTTPHPGKTKAQRDALDRIGCGDNCPPMSDRTRDRMLEEGLIRQLSDKLVGSDAFGPITIPQFEMPIPVHMQWCDAMSEQLTEEDLKELGLD